ncbi:MAG: hypothetical protein KA713_05875 [Chryseotalea sp. WA131a]|nr:MAG: hypothetical protein KA713_05875 [Chryseotalea sp. WA131a]
MTKYKQLGQEQGYVIGGLLNVGKTQDDTTTAVGCHKSLTTKEFIIARSAFIQLNAFNLTILFGHFSPVVKEVFYP